MRRSNTLVARALAFCAAALLFAVLPVACGALGMSAPEPKWVEATVEPPNETILKQVTILSLTKVGFPIGTGIEAGKLGGVSGWNTSAAPFKSEGFRERCYVEYKSLGGRRYQLKVRVERQTNEDIMHPLDLSYAEWEPAPDNEPRAKLVVGQVKAFLKPEFKTSAQQ